MGRASVREPISRNLGGSRPGVISDAIDTMVTFVRAMANEWSGGDDSEEGNPLWPDLHA